MPGRVDQSDSSAILNAGRVELRQRQGLVVKGKRISCPPQYGYRDPAKRARRLRQRHAFERGFPLIRSLRASAQRSTSVLFSFVLSLLIVAGSFVIRQSKTILARSCEAESVSFRGRMKS
jgi:hypothetical protein